MQVKYVLAKDYCDSVRDGTHDTPQATHVGKKLVTSKHIKGGEINDNEAYCISEEDYEKINKRSKVHKWDVLMSMIGTVGEAAVVKKDPDYAIKNIALFKCGSEIKAKWLYYYLSSPLGKGQIFCNLKGSSQQFISLEKLKRLIIPVPEPAEMKKLVEFIAAFDELIENCHKQIKLLEEAAQRLYKEWFVDFRYPGHEATPITNGVPQSWKIVKLSEILDIRYGKDHKTLSTGDVPVYGSGGLMRHVDSFLYNGEAVLIPRKGTLNNIMLVSGKFWTVDTMFYGVPKLNGMGTYIYNFLKRMDMNAYNIGAAVPSMTTKILNTLRITIPEERLLILFNNVTSTYYESCRKLHQKIGLLIEARNRLLPKLLHSDCLARRTEISVDIPL